MGKRTRLHELTERKSNLNESLRRTPRVQLIDPVVLMLAELSEHAFGPELIDDIATDITLTQCDTPTPEVLEFLTGEFFKQYLFPVLQEKRRDGKSTEGLGKLGKLTRDTYVDYFVLFTTMFDSDRNADKEFYRATTGVQGILLGYQTNNSYQICDGIVTFFREMKDGLGLETLIRSLCLRIKQKGKLK